MEQRAPERPVAELAGARMPADHGLASLGLVMQLGGSIFLVFSAFLALLPLFAGGYAVGQPDAWTSFLIGAMGAVRSVFHRSAGTALIYGSPAGPLRATRAYILVSVITTVLSLVILSRELGFATAEVVSIGLLLIAWPATLATVLAWPRLRRLSGESLPTSEDLGFEGVAVLMSIFGALGAVFSGIVFLLLVKLPSGFSSPEVILFAGVFLMLLIRSGMQAKAGVQVCRGVSADRASDSAARYYSFGVISSVIAGGALMVEVMMGGALHPVELLLIAVVVYWLLSWPLLLRRFYTERNFTVLLAGNEAPVFRRAPDAGLTALGWLLLALGVLGLADALPGAILGAEAGDLGISNLLSGGYLVEGAARSEWWNVGVAGVQIWAAIELVTMSDRHRLATNVYGAVAGALALFIYWPLFQTAGELLAFDVFSIGNLLPYGFLLISLVVPVAAVLLVNRKLTPEAQARVRTPDV